MTQFYFVAVCNNPLGDALTVIDLAHCVDYERDEWAVVDQINFKSHTDAIAHARRLARLNRMIYKPFESRYDSSLNEPLLEFY